MWVCGCLVAVIPFASQFAFAAAIYARRDLAAVPDRHLFDATIGITQSRYWKISTMTPQFN